MADVVVVDHFVREPGSVSPVQDVSEPTTNEIIILPSLDEAIDIGTGRCMPTTLRKLVASYHGVSVEMTQTAWKQGWRQADPQTMRCSPPAKLVKWPADAIGDRLDAMDHVGKWYPAKVIDRDGKQFKVHFERWEDRWDEWIKIDQMAPQGAMVYTWNLPISGERALRVESRTPGSGYSYKNTVTIDKHIFHWTFADHADVITHTERVGDILWHEVVAYRERDRLQSVSPLQVVRGSDCAIHIMCGNCTLVRVFD